MSPFSAGSTVTREMNMNSDGAVLVKHHANSAHVIKSALKTAARPPEYQKKTVSFAYLETEKREHNDHSDTDDAGMKTAYTITGGSKGIKDMDIAKEAVMAITDIEERFVQLAIDAHVLELGVTFDNVQELFLVASEIAESPYRQEKLLKSIQQRMENDQHGAASMKGGDQSEQRRGGKSANTEDDCQKSFAGMSEKSQSVSESGSGCLSPALQGAGQLDSKGTTSTTNATICTTKDQKTAIDDSFQTSVSTPVISTVLKPVLKPENPPTEMLEAGGSSKPLTTLASTEIPSTVHALEQSCPQTSPSGPDTDTPEPESPTQSQARIQLQQRVQDLTNKNRKLKKRKYCRACRKVDLASSGITFLPCGHFITCEKCSEMFDDCPACGKNIMGTVRTFLS